MPPPEEAEVEVEQPSNASTLLSVSWRAWRLLGRDCGPTRTAVLRLALVTGGPPIIERVDGRPMGVISERCREAIDQALQELRERERGRRYRTTTRHLRGVKPAAAAPAPEAAAGPADAALEPRVPDGGGETAPAVPTAPATAGAKRTPTGIFRCDKQAITDRIERLKREARPTEPRSEPKSDPKTDAVARIAALRALQAPRRSDDGAMTPFDEAPSTPAAETPPDKRASSVFRCEREVITDRITRLKRKADVTPLPLPQPPPDGTWDGETR